MNYLQRWLLNRLERHTPSPSARRNFLHTVGTALAGAATASAAADSGTTDEPFTPQWSNNSAPTLLRTKMKEFFSAMDFVPDNQKAAIRNGTSTWDATPALQNALDEIRQNLRKPLRLEGGKWIVSQSLNAQSLGKGCRSGIIGEGNYATLIESHLTEAFPVVDFGMNPGGYLRDFNISASPGSQESSGIFCWGQSAGSSGEIKISNVGIACGKLAGIVFYSTDLCQVSDSAILGLGGPGIIAGGEKPAGLSSKFARVPAVQDMTQFTVTGGMVASRAAPALLLTGAAAYNLVGVYAVVEQGAGIDAVIKIAGTTPGARNSGNSLRAFGIRTENQTNGASTGVAAIGLSMSSRNGVIVGSLNSDSLGRMIARLGNDPHIGLSAYSVDVDGNIPLFGGDLHVLRFSGRADPAPQGPSTGKSLGELGDDSSNIDISSSTIRPSDLLRAAACGGRLSSSDAAFESLARFNLNPATPDVAMRPYGGMLSSSSGALTHYSAASGLKEIFSQSVVAKVLSPLRGNMPNLRYRLEVFGNLSTGSIQAGEIEIKLIQASALASFAWRHPVAADGGFSFMLELQNTAADRLLGRAKFILGSATWASATIDLSKQGFNLAGDDLSVHLSLSNPADNPLQISGVLSEVL